jgi:hypothetical protein
MSAEAKNFEAITKAKADHNKHCPFPPHTVRMNPYEIERMQWEEGDVIAGLVLESDPKLGTGAFRLVCDGMEPPELEIEEVEVIGARPSRSRSRRARRAPASRPPEGGGRLGGIGIACANAGGPATLRVRQIASSRSNARAKSSTSRPAAQRGTRSSPSDVSSRRTLPSSTWTCAARTS